METNEMTSDPVLNDNLKEFQRNEQVEIPNTFKPGRKTFFVPIEQIIDNLPGFNCRGKINPSTCVELANEIQQKGLLFPPIVRPYTDERFPGKEYALVAGFRRFIAHKILKVKNIEVEIRTDLDERQARILNLTENLEREDLNMMQEARAFQVLKDVVGLSSKQIAKELNKSVAWVDIRLMALKLEPEIQDKVERGLITQAHIKDIATLSTPEERYEACNKITTAKLRGEIKKLKIGAPKPKKIFSKKNRVARDIYEMQDHMIEQFGNGSIERCPDEIKRLIQILGWVTADASDMEVFDTLRKIAEENRMQYQIPDDAFEALKN